MCTGLQWCRVKKAQNAKGTCRRDELVAQASHAGLADFVSAGLQRYCFRRIHANAACIVAFIVLLLLGVDCRGAAPCRARPCVGRHGALCPASSLTSSLSNAGSPTVLVQGRGDPWLATVAAVVPLRREDFCSRANALCGPCAIHVPPNTAHCMRIISTLGKPGVQMSCRKVPFDARAVFRAIFTKSTIVC